MDDLEVCTTDIATNLIAIAEALAPHLADRAGLVERLDEALTLEWSVLESGDALDGLHFGTSMVLFGIARL